MKRRHFLQQTFVLAGVPALASAAGFQLWGCNTSAGTPFQVHQWERDTRNPVFPPGGGTFDTGCCMNPFVIIHNDQYLLFYAGGDDKGNRRICLATAPINDIYTWKRHGPLFDLGGKGAFDEFWCVLPCVHKIGDKWHLYYTGRSTDNTGLQSFRGIGLATSDDLFHWEKYADEPVLLGGGFSRWPNNKGIAGGGRIIEHTQPDGRILYQMHYTLATGTPSDDLLVDQAKYSVAVHSYDGFEWFDRKVVLGPRLDAPYENAATIALNIWKTSEGWRAIYAGIGTQFGAYSICEASSKDGETWERGAPGENLALPPSDSPWENEMTEYPNVVREGDKLRLFYCGNGYGRTGIGTALANPIE